MTDETKRPSVEDIERAMAQGKPVKILEDGTVVISKDKEDKEDKDAEPLTQGLDLPWSY